MTIRVLTLFPEILEGYLRSSIVGKAVERGQIRVDLVNIRDFARDKHRNCDDAPYGGGSGMVLKPEPLAAAIESLGDPEGPRIYLTPSGRTFNQRWAEDLAVIPQVTLICGRYEGVDQRIIDLFVTDEMSVGDYVLNGGEVAAMVVIDAVSRLVEGVISAGSLEEESFGACEGMLEYPHYTRPEVFRGMRVPEVLLTGHHARIAAWRRRMSVEKTLRLRSDLMKSRTEGDDDGQDTSG